MNTWQIAAVLAIAAPLAFPLAGFAVKRQATGKFAIAGASVALIATLVLLLVNAFDAPVSLLSTDEAGAATFGIHVDRTGSILLLLITGVLLTVQGFADRYLLGDPRAARFSVLCGATATATLTAAAAATFSLMVAAWCAAGVGLCLMLLHRNELPEARLGARRTATTFMIGDGALLASLGIVLATGADLDLRDTSAAAASISDRELAGIPVAAIVASLIAVAALARSAQFPLHRWLPATLAAPTPVSAVLHAGLVNGAGLLLITLAPIVALEPAVLWVLLAAGLATALMGTAFSLVRSDVKGSLAWSTTAQMGFMVAQCATGGFAAALLHMFGHGIYKANLFLGSGGVVASHVREGNAPNHGSAGLLPSKLRLAVAVALPAALLAAAIILIAPHLLEQPGVPVLIGFALASAGHATWSWLSSASGVGGRNAGLAAATLVVACFGYIAVVAGVESFVAAEMPPIADATPSSWIVPIVIASAALLAVAVRTSAPRSEAAAGIEMAAWATARSLSDPSRVSRAVTPKASAEAFPTTSPVTIGANQ